MTLFSSRLMRQRWSRGRTATDPGLVVRDTAICAIPAPGRVSLALDLPGTARAIACSGIYWNPGEAGVYPVMVETSYVPLESAGAWAHEPRTPGQVIELGPTPAHFTEDIAVRHPSFEEAQQLRISRSAPVVEVARTALTGQGRAVEFNTQILVAATWSLRYQVPA